MELFLVRYSGSLSSWLICKMKTLVLILGQDQEVTDADAPPRLRAVTEVKPRSGAICVIEDFL